MISALSRIWLLCFATVVFLAPSSAIFADEFYESAYNDPRYNCEQYSYDASQCNRVRGCQYSRFYGRCVNFIGPVQPVPPSHPYPSATPCQRYYNNPYACQQVGCFYDGRSGACYAQGSGYPNPGQGQLRWICSASDYNWENHRQGHESVARTRYEAEQSALALCLRYHSQCVVTYCCSY